MGQERMLLIVVTIFFVAIATAVGFFLFSSNARSSNKDGLIVGINTLATSALQYRARPGTLGGGNGEYSGYYIPQKLMTTDDGNYAAMVSRTLIVFTGTSKSGYGSVQATLDSTGSLKDFSFTGEFQ
jgi:hypothetical protein